jgi:hypothetical protein
MKYVQGSLFEESCISETVPTERERKIQLHRLLEDIEFDKVCSAQDEFRIFIEYRNEGYFNGTVEEWFSNIGSENLLPYLTFV